LRTSPGKVVLATTDILIEDTHFTRELTTPYLLGSKALAVSLSDIAAMGADPSFYLVTLNLPPEIEMNYLKSIYRGMNKQARKFKTILTGGNLSRSKYISISTTVLGEMPEDEVIYRNGASAGDDIYITGHPGDSALGLAVLRKHGLCAMTAGPNKREVRKHLEPEPRLAIGRSLARKKAISAMMDISDGLLLDLGRLCRASRVGALIEAEALPTSRAMRQSGEGFLETALTGGEDYELLFTAPPVNCAAIQVIGTALKTKITRIGCIQEAARGIKVRDKEGRPLKMKAAASGFSHF
jgi:thiamine-monophosphate kinase